MQRGLASIAASTTLDDVPLLPLLWVTLVGVWAINMACSCLPLTEEGASIIHRSYLQSRTGATKILRDTPELWRKKPIKKNHIKEFGGRMPRTSQGQTRDVPGTPGTNLGLIFMCKSILKGQNAPGTDGTYHGTDGTCPRDRRDAHQGVSRQNSLCLLVFVFPQEPRQLKTPGPKQTIKQVKEASN